MSVILINTRIIVCPAQALSVVVVDIYKQVLLVCLFSACIDFLLDST